MQLWDQSEMRMAGRGSQRQEGSGREMKLMTKGKKSAAAFSSDLNLLILQTRWVYCKICLFEHMKKLPELF